MRVRAMEAESFWALEQVWAGMILACAALIAIGTSRVVGPDGWDLALKAGFGAMLAAAWPAHRVMERLRGVRLAWAPYLLSLASQVGRGGNAAFRAEVEQRLEELPSAMERRLVLLLSEKFARGEAASGPGEDTAAEIQAMAQLVRERTGEALHYKSLTVAITAGIAHVVSRLSSVPEESAASALAEAVSSLTTLSSLDRAA